MNILRKLTKLDLKLNKKRTIGTLLGIILATALITVVGGMFEVLRNTLVKTTIDYSGYYHVQLVNVDKNDLEKIKDNKDFSRVMSVGYTGLTHIGLENEEEGNMDSLVISMDEDTFKELKQEVLEGTFPKNNKEILIDNNLSKYYDIKVGDTINVATDINVSSLGGYEVTYDKLEEYKVVGIGSYYGTSVTTKDDSSMYMAYLTLKNPRNHKKAISNLLGVNDYRKDKSAKYVANVNRELLRWEVFSFSEDTTKFLTTVLAVVILIILVTSVFSIRNSFAISTNEKIRLYGMLASTGATKKQIKRMVLFEGLCLGIIGIGGGIILGSFVVWLLTLIINTLAVNANLVDNSMLYYKFSFISIIMATLVSIVMIYLSTISSSRKASKVSPIQNIRNSDNIKAKKLRVPFFIRKIFATGGVLAYKNLKRSKKKYRVTVISLSVSILIFIMVSSFLEYGLREINNEFGGINYDVALHLNGTEENEVNLKQLLSLSDGHAIYSDYNHSRSFIYDDSHVVSDEGKADMCSKYDENYNCIEREYAVNSREYYYDDASFKEICKKSKIDYNYAKDKAIITDYAKIDKKYYRLTNYKKGDKFTLTNIEENINMTYEVAGVTEFRPWGIDNNYRDVIIILNKEYYQGDNELGIDAIYYKTKNASKLVDDLQKIDESFDIENISELAKQINTIIIIFSIFVYGFIIVVTLIGVTSVFNTINSNMELRKREFATLKSIGMTKREFNRMILLESIFYSMKSLFFGIILGLAGSYLVYKAFSGSMDFGYILPVKSIIISIVFIIVLVYTIMKYSLSKTNKQNIIETIRKENI